MNILQITNNLDHTKIGLNNIDFTVLKYLTNIQYLVQTNNNALIKIIFKCCLKTFKMHF